MTAGPTTKWMKTRWPAAVGRFGETAPGFGGSPNRPTVEVSGHQEYSASVANTIFKGGTL